MVMTVDGNFSFGNVSVPTAGTRMDVVGTL